MKNLIAEATRNAVIARTVPVVNNHVRVLMRRTQHTKAAGAKKKNAVGSGTTETIPNESKRLVSQD